MTPYEFIHYIGEAVIDFPLSLLGLIAIVWILAKIGVIRLDD